MSNESKGRVAGKVALVTGAASNPGLGYTIAMTLAAEGARLVVTDIDADGAQVCADAIIAAGGEALAMGHDVTSESDWQAAVDATAERFGGLDILVNNAGIALLRPVAKTTTEQWSAQIDVNLNGVFLGCKVGLVEMRKRGGGSVINMSSVAGLVGTRTTFAYAATKGGVLAMSRVVAVEEAAHNIRCNTIHPGMIWTNMQAAATGMSSPDDFEVSPALIPLGRQGTPQDIANMALFLASDEASYVTGTQLVVDGGMTAQ